VSTTTTNTGNTGDGTTSTPGLGGGLVTRHLVDGVGLTTVLGDLIMNEGHDVASDGGGEDGRQSNLAGLTGEGLDGNGGTGGLKGENTIINGCNIRCVGSSKNIHS
jgi:hypothetical protein